MPKKSEIPQASEVRKPTLPRKKKLAVKPAVFVTEVVKPISKVQDVKPEPPETSDGERMQVVPPMTKSRRLVIPLTTLRSVIIGLILLVLGFGAGYNWRTNAPGFLAGGDKQVGLDRNGLDFSLFWQVWDRLQTSYVDPEKLDAQKMVYGAIEGMTASLGDPYTVFLPPSDNEQAKQDLNGAFEGVGIQLGYKNESLAVQAPLEGHPAIKAGVRAGDYITHIKDEVKKIDKDTSGMKLQEAVQLIRGPKGTSVTLTFYREGKGEFVKTIVRDRIVMPSVELKIGAFKGDVFTEDAANGGVAWLKVNRFGDQTMDEWNAAVGRIVSARTQLRGIVLDLRNNPGGYLNDAISMASDFIPEGVVVKQQGRYETETHTVNRPGRLLTMPVVILVNGGSASASEILAGALRDRLGAKLVGENSFGKGTVQEVMDLTEKKAGLHVTTAKWLLPSGEWIHDSGLKPDVEVKLPEPATDSATIRDTQLEKAIETLQPR